MNLRSAAALIASLLILSACGAAGSSEGDTTSGGPWTFTDGSGKTVELPQTPTRIIAHAGEAAALMTYGIRPVGIYADESVETDPNLEGLDLTGIEILGEEWGNIDVEKAAALRPDLIVADWWPAEQAYSGLEEGVKEKSKKLKDLAPIVGMSQGKSILDLAEGYEKLAESLGADVDDPELAADRTRFEKALAGFKELTSAKPGLTALAVSPTNDLLYVANPEYAPELQDFQKWGLDVISPDNPDKGFPYWENLSWENADRYQPDVLLIDGRQFESTLEQGEKQPTWDSIRAARAGAVVEWPAFWLHTFGHYATALEKLTADLSEIDPEIGD